MRLKHSYALLLYVVAVNGFSFTVNPCNKRQNTSSYLKSHAPFGSPVTHSSILQGMKSSTTCSDTLYSPPKLSIIIPAYNEKDRIEQTLIDYSSHLSKCSTFLDLPTEILVVDDGSSDNTHSEVYRVANILKAKSAEIKDVNSPSGTTNVMISPFVSIRCISLPQNAGKGAAITEGCLNVRDESSIILTADADGSGNIESLENMIMKFYQTISSATLPYPISSPWDAYAMLVGFRMYDEEAASKSSSKSSELSLSSSPIIRSIFRWGFRTTVKTICFPQNLGVQDTQCGFKLMTSKTAKLLYPRLNLKRWTHDVELLFLAQKLGSILVCETEIGWVDKEGSKFIETPRGTIKVILQMLSDVLTMRLKYLTGEWNV